MNKSAARRTPLIDITDVGQLFLELRQLRLAKRVHLFADQRRPGRRRAIGGDAPPRRPAVDEHDAAAGEVDERQGHVAVAQAAGAHGIEQSARRLDTRMQVCVRHGWEAEAGVGHAVAQLRDSRRAASIRVEPVLSQHLADDAEHA